jgi:hypothetical protein
MGPQARAHACDARACRRATAARSTRARVMRACACADAALTLRLCHVAAVFSSVPGAC